MVRVFLIVSWALHGTIIKSIWGYLYGYRYKLVYNFYLVYVHIGKTIVKHIRSMHRCSVSYTIFNQIERDFAGRKNFQA